MWNSYAPSSSSSWSSFVNFLGGLALLGFISSLVIVNFDIVIFILSSSSSEFHCDGKRHGSERKRSGQEEEPHNCVYSTKPAGSLLYVSS